jgi:hypothetical protein
MNMKLREELSALKLNVFEHIEAVTALKKTFNHSIEPIKSGPWLPSYTCLVYALNFAGNATYAAVIKKANHEQAFAGKEFFDWLIVNRLLIQVKDGSESKGDFVVYFNFSQEFKHVGILSDENRVRSKWGVLGLFHHEIFDVPSDYGDNIKFFKPIKYDEAMAAFKLFLAGLVSRTS